MKKNKIQLFKNTKGKWQWRLRWSNGEIGASSEVYTTKRGAFKSAKKMFSYLWKFKDWVIE